MLADEAKGTVLMIPFFETEDDRATADETLKTMTPPGGMGRPTVEMYEVKLDLTAPE